ncbi:MAG: hypothetical protein KF773_23920 [Deltaproteobacteria bacterium]|nr:hypothetical protein [Deltaproteobacteria bacterium]
MSHDRDVQRQVAEAGRGTQRDARAGGDHAAQRASDHQMMQVAGQAGQSAQKDAPTQAYADESLMHAIQAHVKLTASRMYAGAARIAQILATRTGGGAGTAPLLGALEAEVQLVNVDLERVIAEISRVQRVMNAALDQELGALQGAFHGAWVQALNKIYTFTHDQDGKLKPDAQGRELGITPSQRSVARIFELVGKEPGEVRATYAPAHAPDDLAAARDAELQAAELEGLQAAMYSVEVAADLVKADLHSSVQDQSKEAITLTTSVDTLVAMFEPIDPAHIGKMTKLPVLIRKVEGLQAEINGMKESGSEKGKALAPRLGYNTTLSSDLYRLKQKMQSVQVVNKANRRRP